MSAPRGDRRGWSLAIDFGTSFTVAAMAVHGRVEIVEIDNSRYLPSLVCLDEDGGLLVGHEAQSEAAADPARAERLPKRAMVTGEHVRLGDRTIGTVDLVAAVLARVAGEAARRHAGRRPDRTVLTHPAGWRPGGLELRRLTRAAEVAGLGEPDLVAEPVAAAHHYVDVSAAGNPVPLGGVIGVYDLGGGTFDTAVLRRRRDGFELAGPPGGDLHLGGEDLDASLLDVLAGHAEAVDPDRWADLWEADGRGAERNRSLLRREITQAKHTLSARSAVNIYVPGFDDELRVTRGEYEKAVDDHLRRSVREMAETVRRAGAEPGALADLYLTGGSSRTPRISALLTEELGLLPVTLDDPKAVVAQGALAAVPGSVSVQTVADATTTVHRPGPSGPPAPPGAPRRAGGGIDLRHPERETAVVGRDQVTVVRRAGPGGSGPHAVPAAPAPVGSAGSPDAAGTASELRQVVVAAGVGALVAPVTDDSARLGRSAVEIARAIGTRHCPFPGLTPEIALQVLREGRDELGELGDAIARLDRVTARFADPAPAEAPGAGRHRPDDGRGSPPGVAR